MCIAHRYVKCLESHVSNPSPLLGNVFLPRFDTTACAMSGLSRRALVRAVTETSHRATLARAVTSRRADCLVRSRRDVPHQVWSRFTEPSRRIRAKSADAGFAVRGLATKRGSSGTPESILQATDSKEDAKEDSKKSGDARVDASSTDPKDLSSAPLPINPRKDLYMMFTCGKCETRAAKGFSRQAYENGVVIVRCPGCDAQHVVADHHGWFGEKGTIEDFLKEKNNGQTVARGMADLLNGVGASASAEGTLEIDAEQLKKWMENSGVLSGTNNERGAETCHEKGTEDDTHLP